MEHCSDIFYNENLILSAFKTKQTSAAWKCKSRLEKQLNMNVLN